MSISKERNCLAKMNVSRFWFVEVRDGAASFLFLPVCVCFFLGLRAMIPFCPWQGRLWCRLPTIRALGLCSSGRLRRTLLLGASGAVAEELPPALEQCLGYSYLLGSSQWGGGKKHIKTPWDFCCFFVPQEDVFFWKFILNIIYKDAGIFLKTCTLGSK